MTKDEILAMEPGWELDLFVAEKVMDWEISCEHTPCYSTDIFEAWKIFVAMKSKPFSERFRFTKTLKALLHLENRVEVVWPDALWTVTPEIICTAALIAVSGDEIA